MFECEVRPKFMRNSEAKTTARKFSIMRLVPGQVAQFRQVNEVFARAFDDPDSYSAHKPSDEYLQGLLQKPHVIVLASLAGDEVVAGLVAYVLEKFEQERSEVYIYDIGVREDFRRLGIATSLINELKRHAREIGAWVVYVQADKGEEDIPAQRLYESLGEREDVFHYDIDVD
jgi:aminoglycoside 3-N-acetyltransferase I